MSAANEKNVGEETPLQEPIQDVVPPSDDDIALDERRSDESTEVNEAESTTGFTEAESTTGFTEAEFNSCNSPTPVSSAPVGLPPISSLIGCIGRLIPHHLIK